MSRSIRSDVRRSCANRRHCSPAVLFPRCGPFAVPIPASTPEYAQTTPAAPAFRRILQGHRIKSSSGRQDLNLRPPGPQPERSGVSECSETRVYWVSVHLCLSMLGLRDGRSRLQVEAPRRNNLEKRRWRRVGERQDLAGELERSTPPRILLHTGCRRDKTGNGSQPRRRRRSLQQRSASLHDGSW
jgi:hypothetical protein